MEMAFSIYKKSWSAALAIWSVLALAFGLSGCLVSPTIQLRLPGPTNSEASKLADGQETIVVSIVFLKGSQQDGRIADLGRHGGTFWVIDGQRIPGGNEAALSKLLTAKIERTPDEKLSNVAIEVRCEAEVVYEDVASVLLVAWDTGIMRTCVAAMTANGIEGHIMLPGRHRRRDEGMSEQDPLLLPTVIRITPPDANNAVEFCVQGSRESVRDGQQLFDMFEHIQERQHSERGPVIIRPDPLARWQDVVEVINQAVRAKFERVLLIFQPTSPFPWLSQPDPHSPEDPPFPGPFQVMEVDLDLSSCRERKLHHHALNLRVS